MTKMFTVDKNNSCFVFLCSNTNKVFRNFRGWLKHRTLTYFVRGNITVRLWSTSLYGEKVTKNLDYDTLISMVGEILKVPNLPSQRTSTLATTRYGGPWAIAVVFGLVCSYGTTSMPPRHFPYCHLPHFIYKNEISPIIIFILARVTK